MTTKHRRPNAVLSDRTFVLTELNYLMSVLNADADDLARPDDGPSSDIASHLFEAAHVLDLIAHALTHGFTATTFEGREAEYFERDDHDTAERRDHHDQHTTP